MKLLGHDLGELLECPRWHPERERISFVDIPTGRLFEVSSDCQFIDEFVFGISPLGAALPFEAGYLLVGVDEICYWDPADSRNSIHVWASIPHSEGIIPNDAFVHEGAVWAGRIGESEERGRGSVWKISPGEAHLVVSGLTLPNGMVLSPDREHILLAESVHQALFQLPLDARGLTVDDLQCFGDLKGWTPDGLAWDNDSQLWVARWGDACVSCLSDRGFEDVLLPTPQVTALAFDPDGSLFVTTGREGFTQQQRLDDSLAGSLFTNSPKYGGPVSPRRNAPISLQKQSPK